MNVIEFIDSVLPNPDVVDFEKIKLTKEDFWELLRLARHGQSMQWVSVKENPPENYRTVIVCGTATLQNKVITAAYLSNSGCWYSIDKHIGLLPDLWMPLPPGLGKEGVE